MSTKDGRSMSFSISSLSPERIALSISLNVLKTNINFFMFMVSFLTTNSLLPSVKPSGGLITSPFCQASHSMK